MDIDPSRIELRDITADTFDDVIALQVADEQRDLVPPAVESIAWAFVAPECHPLAIYLGDTPVGFVMYGYVPDDGRCWIVGFMVDARYQRQGIGRTALEQLLTRMSEVSGGGSLLLAVRPDNTPAVRLYEAFGFVDTGKRQGDEMIMRRAGTR
jgi:diamine N-acetyltransferase